MSDRPPYLAQTMTSTSTSSSVPTVSTTTTNQTTPSEPMKTSHSSTFPQFFHRHNRGSSIGSPDPASQLDLPTSPSRGSFFGSFSHSRSNSRTRAKSPAPAPIDTSGQHTAHSGQRTTSPTHMSPEMTTPDSVTDELHKKKRHSRKSSGTNHRRRSGNVTQVGRHGNDWLFNGFSVRDHVGKLLDNEKGGQ